MVEDDGCGRFQRYRPEALSLALATCREFPQGYREDVLADALDATWAVWDDPTVDWGRFDLVVVRSTWDYTRDLDGFLRWARGVPRLLNPPELLAWNTDKAYLADLRDAGLPVVDTSLVAPGEPFTAPEGGYVVKPAVSAGARDTARFAPGEEARAAALVASIHASGRTALVQPYIASVDERGETSLILFDGVLSHAVAKGPLLEPGASPHGGFGADPNITHRSPSAEERALARKVVHGIADRFGMPLYARIDVVQAANGHPELLEAELTEPHLFLGHAPGATGRLAAAIAARQ